MRKNRKWMLRVLCAALVLALCPLTALAGELSVAVSKAYRLLFATDNVTLGLQAELDWDGERFKTVEGKLYQQGVSSRMEVTLCSPRPGAADYRGSYIVSSESGNILSWESGTASMYESATGGIRTSAVTDTALRRAGLWLMNAVLDSVEGVLPPMLCVEQEDGGSEIRFTWQEGDVPELLNAAVTLLAEGAADRWRAAGFDLRSPGGANGDSMTAPGCFTVFRDWDASFETAYRARYGKDIPEALWMETGEEETPLWIEYLTVCDDLSALWEDTSRTYPDAYAVIAEDNTPVLYPDYGSYAVGENDICLYYDDEDATFINWYNARFPDCPINRRTLVSIETGGNWELYDAYEELRYEMNMEHMERMSGFPGAQGVVVSREGNLTGIPDVEGYGRIPGIDGTLTVTDYICAAAVKFEIAGADIRVAYDREGGLTEVSGSVTLHVTDLGGMVHDLTADFTATAGDYGTTVARPLSLDGLVNEDEYYSRYEEFFAKDHPDLAAAPSDTVVFAGKTYRLWEEE